MGYKLWLCELRMKSDRDSVCVWWDVDIELHSATSQDTDTLLVC